MPQLTERDAEKHSPEQATALVRLLDLQAKWDGLLVQRGQKTALSELHARQKANDAYQSALREYTAKYRFTDIPEPTQAMPRRMAIWCRVLRIVFSKAHGAVPTEVMAKVYRLADRLAERLGKDPVARQAVEDMSGAVRELDVVISWCDELATATTPAAKAA